MATTTQTLGRMLINGQWREAAEGRTLAVINPATEEALSEVAYGGRREAQEAIDAAFAALPDWRRRTAWERAGVLKRTADLMRQRSDAIARTLTQEQGKPLAEAKAEILHSADTFEWFAEEGKRAYGQVIPQSQPHKRHLTLKHPVGVVAAISPWNFPVTLQSRKIAPALAAGCTVVSRPASQTPLSLIQVYECLVEAGLPAGAANLVFGPAEELSEEFLTNRKCAKISFTGSTEVGKHLLRRSADQMKRLSLELGGHAPFVIFPDADPQHVAKIAVVGKFRNNGQVCISPSRFYVHEKIAEEFRQASVELARGLKLGNGLEPGVEIGPMFDERAMEQAASLIDDARRHGAKVLTGGGRSERFERGYFFEPTVVAELSPEMRLLTDEPFAPVMPLLNFRQIEEVIQQANNTPYGLAAYVFTNDLTTMWRMAEGLEAGIIAVNDPVPATPQCPFGGMKESGLGRELAHEGLEAYLETKAVSMVLRE
jgi:succinate-semialdehyde dehydrogenase/glutarate-semialdehyde dehydrogenase